MLYNQHELNVEILLGSSDIVRGTNVGVGIIVGTGGVISSVSDVVY